MKQLLQEITMDRLKMLFGFVLLGILGFLALAIGLGKVEAATSYGLLPIISTLATLGGGFAQWAFRTDPQPGQGLTQPPKPPEEQ